LPEAKKRAVGNRWNPLYTKGCGAVAALRSDDAHDEDLPTPVAGAGGPANIVKRLRIGLDPMERFEHHFHRIVAEGDTVVLEPTEVWRFETGEVVRNPFVTVREVREGKITLWKDYWDLNTLMSAVPKWWIEPLASDCEKDFGAS